MNPKIVERQARYDTSFGDGRGKVVRCAIGVTLAACFLPCKGRRNRCLWTVEDEIVLVKAYGDCGFKVASKHIGRYQAAGGCLAFGKISK